MKAKILLGLFFLSHFGSLGYANPCPPLSAFYQSYNEQNKQTDVILVASSFQLREFNKVFGGWSKGSEYVTDVTHFFFQYFLRQNLDRINSFPILSVRSPYVKFVILTLEGNPGAHEALTQAATLAKRQAVEAVAALFFDQNPQSELILQQIMGATSPLGRTGLYGFAEGRTYLTQASSSEEGMISVGLKKFFHSKEAFIKSYYNAYGVGMSNSDLDSHSAARLTSIDPNVFGGAVFFDMSALQNQALDALKARTNLHWLFDGRSDQQLIGIFQAIRTNALHDSPRDWNGAYKQVLATSDTNSMIRRHLQIKDYITAINIFDYLPIDSITVDPKLRTQFDQLSNPTGALYLDVRQVGARNMLRLHKLIEPLLGKLNSLDREFENLKQAELVQADTGKIPGHIAGIYGEIINMRREVFRDTGEFLDDKRARLTKLIEDVGIAKNHYAIWASGDDIFVVFRSSHALNRAQDLAITLKANSSFNSDVRIGYMSINGRSNFPLDVARLSVGKTSEILKFSESLDFSYELIAEYKPTQDGKPAAILARIEGDSLVPVPPDDFSLIQLGLPHWQVYNYRSLH